MKIILQVAGTMLALFMLGSPIISEAAQSSSTTGYAAQDQQIGYSTGIHNRNKKKAAPAAPAPKPKKVY